MIASLPRSGCIVQPRVGRVGDLPWETWKDETPSAYLIEPRNFLKNQKKKFEQELTERTENVLSTDWTLFSLLSPVEDLVESVDRFWNCNLRLSAFA